MSTTDIPSRGIYRIAVAGQDKVLTSDIGDVVNLVSQNVLLQPAQEVLSFLKIPIAYPYWPFQWRVKPDGDGNDAPERSA